MCRRKADISIVHLLLYYNKRQDFGFDQLNTIAYFSNRRRKQMSQKGFVNNH